jgi:GNAT superfamily N-acetyltransferase
MICRAARSDDSAAMAKIVVDAYRSVFTPLLPTVELSVFDVDHFTARFSRQWPNMRVVELEDTIIAFAMITQGHLDMFFVDENRRSMGVGQMFLADAVAQGACTLETFAANIGARRFYEREGWQLGATSARPFGSVICEFVSYAAPGKSGRS